MTPSIPARLLTPAKGGSPYQPAPKHVLLASDDDELRGEVAKALRRDGHHVVELDDGSELLDYLSDARGTRATLPAADAIIASLTMTGLGGLELLEALRQIDDRTPFIGLAGLHEAGSFERMRALGAEYLFEGPLRVDDLREALHSIPGGEFPEDRASHEARLDACERGTQFMNAEGRVMTASASPIGEKREPGPLSAEGLERVADAKRAVEAAQHEVERAMKALTLEVPRAQKTLISDALRRAFDQLAEARTKLEALTTTAEP